ncbi:A24 family peptidase [Cohnella hongkongensis]|uniref:Prepilin peptidase n=1 Tax=Cohnella hongkongensis TaxID=178337 RepID=A0ABV9FH49_9BACL
MNLWEWLIAGVLLGSASWTDLRRLRIPNGLNLAFAAGGLAYQFLCYGSSGLVWACAGALCGFVPLYAMNRLGGIGGGDVKWFGAFGTWAGPALTFQLLVVSILIAGGIACLLMALRIPGLRKLGRKLRWPWGEHPASGDRRVRFPFMLAVAPGFLILLGKG